MLFDLRMMWTEAVVMPWLLSIRRAWTLCVQEESLSEPEELCISWRSRQEDG